MPAQVPFLALTTEPKKQQFMHSAVSKMNDLNQLYAVIKTRIKQNCIK